MGNIREELYISAVRPASDKNHHKSRGKRIKGLNEERIITSIINQQLHLHNFHIKHLKSLRHISILSDHHQGALLFLARVILQYSQFN